MPQLLWDASALVKRYVQETGSDTVQSLFAIGPDAPLATTVWGYAETFSILLRRHNGGVISHTAFAKAATALRNEVLQNLEVTFIAVPDALVLRGIGLMRRHNVNTTDAAILATFLEYAAGQPEGSPKCVLVTADKRLARSSRAEGLDALDPELVRPQDLIVVLGKT